MHFDPSSMPQRPASSSSSSSTMPLHSASSYATPSMDAVGAATAAAGIGEATPSAEGRAVTGVLDLGVGLVMSRVYANYWGGDLALRTMNNYGTDAYVTLVTGNQAENIGMTPGGHDPDEQ
ncbi:hypothetical protein CAUPRSCDRAFT_12499 [Caulochytrium protostelioides]|uniref:Protein-serine/threonine kinase n=1 Tax=Caulochytrium protostelioides TaxID=1555241 RepID=A0A4P9WRK4_9FUNG|nr:hypothetical protein CAUPRSCDRAFT_12499 [Caulochytrium protostelioides]